MQQIYAYYDLAKEDITFLLRDLVDKGFVIEQFNVVQEIDHAEYDDANGPDVAYLYTLIVIVRPGVAEWEDLYRHHEKLAY
jgi:hypothetical protein